MKFQALKVFEWRMVDLCSLCPGEYSSIEQKVFQETLRIILTIQVPDPRCGRWAICILESVKFPKTVSGDITMAELRGYSN